MKNIGKKIKALWKDESAQGATEYILLIVIVVGIATFFGPELKKIITQKMSDISGKIQGFDP